MKRAKLNDKINFIKKVLRTPYHFLSFTSEKLILLVLEDKKGKRFTFNGTTICNAVETAEKYVEDEIAAGQFKEPKK